MSWGIVLLVSLSVAVLATVLLFRKKGRSGDDLRKESAGGILAIIKKLFRLINPVYWVRRRTERRLAEEAEVRRLAEKAEARRAEARRLAEEAEARRLAEEAKARRAEDERRLAEMARSERRKNASDFKLAVSAAAQRCKQNEEGVRSIKFSPTYRSVSMQNQLWIALNEFSVSRQQLDAAVAEIASARERAVNALDLALSEAETAEKRKAGPDKLLQKVGEAEKCAQGRVAGLEEIEKTIHEHAVDCRIIVNEYKYTLAYLHVSIMADMAGKHKDELTSHEYAPLKSELDRVVAASDSELGAIKNLESANPVFIEYYRLLKAQEGAVAEIGADIANISGLLPRVRSAVASIEQISRKFADARALMHGGNYDGIRALLPPSLFDKVVGQALSAK